METIFEIKKQLQKQFEQNKEQHKEAIRNQSIYMEKVNDNLAKLSKAIESKENDTQSLERIIKERNMLLEEVDKLSLIISNLSFTFRVNESEHGIWPGRKKEITYTFTVDEAFDDIKKLKDKRFLYLLGDIK